MTETEYLLTCQQFIEKLRNRLTDEEIYQVRAAYELAEQAHRGQTRDEGTPYFNHPIGVALVLIDELGISSADMICAALLHDVVEDSSITVDDIARQFNPAVATLVELLTKRDGVDTASYLQRIEEAASTGALVVKLCDRLNNLRHLRYSPRPQKRVKYLEETRKHFLPLARRASDLIYREMETVILEMASENL